MPGDRRHVGEESRRAQVNRLESQFKLNSPAFRLVLCSQSFFFFPARFCFVFFTRPFGCCRSTYECIFSSTSHLVDFFSLLVQTFFLRAAPKSEFWMMFGAAFRENLSSESTHNPKKREKSFAENLSLKLASQKAACESETSSCRVDPTQSRKLLYLSNMMCLSMVWNHRSRPAALLPHRSSDEVVSTAHAIASFNCPQSTRRQYRKSSLLPQNIAFPVHRSHFFSPLGI